MDNSLRNIGLLTGDILLDKSNVNSWYV